jgi:serine phosphatase RsbU (regulator of sigma subunit)
VLYTDGITEARDRSGRQFGPDRLVAAIAAAAAGPPAGVCDKVLDEVDRWGERQVDDMCLVALRYLG